MWCVVCVQVCVTCNVCVCGVWCVVCVQGCVMCNVCVCRGALGAHCPAARPAPHQAPSGSQPWRSGIPAHTGPARVRRRSRSHWRGGRALTGAVSGGEAWEGRRAPGAQGCRPQSGLSELLIQAVLPFPVVWKDFSSLGTWPHTRVHTCGCGRARGPKELSARPM